MTMVSDKDDFAQPEREVSLSPLGRAKGMNGLRSFLRGEFGGESRVPFWAEELRETRRQVGKEWVKTSTTTA